MGALQLFLPVLTTFVALGQAQDHYWVDLVSRGFYFLLIAASAFLLIRTTKMLEDIVFEQFNVNKEDNRRERKIITQVNFLKKAVIVAIAFISIAIILLSFEEGRRYGQTLLTSAGVAGIIVGFAAQKSIANFLAGIQIAFTQPIKIDDAIVVEGEWGWVEEINLTYVVVRIWDWRRLILPITYFIDKPFQNWTRTKGEIIGTVFLYLDYRAPVQKIRQELDRILESEPNWDGKVKNVQVTDTKESRIVVRALMSAKNSPLAWDLRCSVREKLVDYLRREYPESLPRERLILEQSAPKGANQGYEPN